MLIECLGLGLAQLVFLCLRVLNSSSFPPALDKEEEEKLFLTMREGDEDARQKLIEHNLRLVAHIIKKGHPSRKLFLADYRRNEV